MKIEELFSLEGKIAIVTGASRGLGKAMAEALAGAGANLVVNSRNPEQIVSSAADIQKKTNRKIIPVAADISNPGGAKEVVKIALDNFGKVDILVNNAGIMVRKATLDLTEKDVNDIVDINLKGVLYMSQAAAKDMMKRKWGRIISTGSIHSIVSIAERAAYAATKGAVLQMSKSLALEWAKYGITVNTICPGVFRTEINMDWMEDISKAKPMLAKIPLGYFANPEDLAGTVVYLASEASKYMTGSAVVVDGGYTAQ